MLEGPSEDVGHIHVLTCDSTELGSEPRGELVTGKAGTTSLAMQRTDMVESERDDVLDGRVVMLTFSSRSYQTVVKH